ncbi:hypothetical protein [Aquipseudomonas alcaligenes]|uniref:Uncharacterized protein n=1 Tax=Aquipseudomonas alcaligenes (strain ATCC 14909 / DSM 50342 / CCUG 1425 / JCM 20561 / NBRC 14159 / NCIMB 9945 / NCTC 10367 / 1577) TaxID=1215092 RepID=U2ZHR8_AQUA1|nr:hypothetical protein [Pseudomonas alcaligenes]GAD61020.1 hypothetical protein PA6_003_01490 [Pseudomonas alcaligenes NBRC 14159]SUD13461.1 Uncharacterised protein [Pseudomonas alcaligenes]
MGADSPSCKPSALRQLAQIRGAGLVGREEGLQRQLGHIFVIGQALLVLLFIELELMGLKRSEPVVA